MRTCVVFGCLLALAGQLSAGNILPNSSFEYWLGGMPVGWLTSERLFPGSALPDSNCHTGVYCVKLVGGDTSAFMSTAAIVRPGYNYGFSGFAQTPGVLGGSFVLQFTTLLGGAVGSPELIPVYYSGSGYREYTRWLTAPDSAVFLAVAVATLPGATVYVDDVTLEDTTLAGTCEPRQVAAGQRRAGLNKVVGPGLSRLGSGARPWFDASGRRVAVRSSSAGVFFLAPER